MSDIVWLAHYQDQIFQKFSEKDIEYISDLLAMSFQNLK